MPPLRASEIGTYLYCKRAWWYQRQGLPSENQGALEGGSQYHQEHARRVFVARVLRFSGWVLLLLSAILLAVALTIEWTG